MKGSTITALALLTLASAIALSSQQCELWIDPPFDTDNSSLSDPNGTPVGFRQEILPGSDSSEPDPPCFFIEFTNPDNVNYVAILVYTPSGAVCVNEEGDGPVCGIPGHCEPVALDNSNRARINTGCVESCQDNNIDFFIRFVTISLSTDDEGAECANITNNALFPLDLLSRSTVTPSIDPNPTRATLGAITMHGSLSILLLAAILAKICM